MQHKPLWLFSYDIGCPKRLKKAHKLCSEAGWCLQKSVFVMALTPPEKMAFCKKVEKVVDKQQDRLLCLPFQPLLVVFIGEIIRNGHCITVMNGSMDLFFRDYRYEKTDSDVGF
ncbi:CRISPR-associated endonuclease Cas2 [Photobacterium damselae]|nr:CRISPR-associated endonuclease Cas2 [Photobacterium damselae]EHA1083018.1 CRISPR-associated endonuclease Cas2 [Photobacterium damselae]